jgi:hypothetical protein
MREKNELFEMHEAMTDAIFLVILRFLFREAERQEYPMLLLQYPMLLLQYPMLLLQRGAPTLLVREDEHAQAISRCVLD